MSRGLTPDTFVWREGMPDWVKASTVADLSDLFVQRGPRPYTGRGYNEPYSRPYQDPAAGGPNPQSGYQNPQNAYDPMGGRGYLSPIPHTNWLPWAIVSTVLNCFCSCIGLVFSIIGIVQANKANDYYARQMQLEGDAANSSAKTMTIISFAIAGIGLIGTIILVISGMAGAFSTLYNV